MKILVEIANVGTKNVMCLEKVLDDYRSYCKDSSKSALKDHLHMILVIPAMC